MIRYLTLSELLDLHGRILEQSGAATGVRDLGILESALAQPGMTFDGEELYPTLVDKAAALGFFIVMNHPFIDGNKRVGHAAMEIFLFIHGMEIIASIDEQETVILSLAAGLFDRDAFTQWLASRIKLIS